MYPAELLIPNVGETASFPQYEGIGLQVKRLGFPGSADPLRNPVIRSRDGSLSANMQVGDPIEQPFDGLEVKNDNAKASGSVALVRIYEQGDVIRSVPKSESLTRQSPPDPDFREEFASFDITRQTGEKYTAIPANTGDIYRVIGITGEVRDNNNQLDNAGRVRFQINFGNAAIYTTEKVASNGKKEQFFVTSGQLVPKERKLDFVFRGIPPLRGSAYVEMRGLFLRDKQAEMPPR